DATPRERWTESLREQLLARVRVTHPQERAELKMMFFDPQAALHRRLNVSSGGVPCSSLALDFASGKLPLGALPESPIAPNLKSFDTAKVSLSAYDVPQDEEHFIHEQRRKAAGGLRAEEAVLGICVADALKWFR